MRYFEKNRISNVSGDRINPSTNELLAQVYGAVAQLRSAVGTAADIRVTLLSGTVTTVTTLTGITNIGGNPANLMIPNLQNMVHVLSNLNNIGA